MKRSRKRLWKVKETAVKSSPRCAFRRSACLLQTAERKTLSTALHTAHKAHTARTHTRTPCLRRVQYLRDDRPCLIYLHVVSLAQRGPCLRRVREGHSQRDDMQVDETGSIISLVPPCLRRVLVVQPADGVRLHPTGRRPVGKQVSRFSAVKTRGKAVKRRWKGGGKAS